MSRGEPADFDAAQRDAMRAWLAARPHQGCVWCGYDLVGVEPDERDGADEVRCPECGRVSIFSAGLVRHRPGEVQSAERLHRLDGKLVVWCVIIALAFALVVFGSIAAF